MTTKILKMKDLRRSLFEHFDVQSTKQLEKELIKRGMCSTDEDFSCKPPWLKYYRLIFENVQPNNQGNVQPNNRLDNYKVAVKHIPTKRALTSLMLDEWYLTD